MVGKSNRTKEEKARVVVEALSDTASTSEICKEYNMALSVFYRCRDAFIAGGTVAPSPRQSSEQEKTQRDRRSEEDHRGAHNYKRNIKKKSVYQERWEVMTELIQKEFSGSRAAKLLGISRSMLLRIVEEGPSYGSRRIIAMMSRDGLNLGRNRIRRHMRHLTSYPLISREKEACPESAGCCEAKYNVGD